MPTDVMTSEVLGLSAKRCVIHLDLDAFYAVSMPIATCNSRV